MKQQKQTLILLCFTFLATAYWYTHVPDPLPIETSTQSQRIEEDDQTHPGYYEQWLEEKMDKHGRIPRGMQQRWHENDLRIQRTLSTVRTSSGNVNPFKAQLALGPKNVGGRTRALLVDELDPDVIFAGGVSGGLWRSNTNGSSWGPLIDDAITTSVTTITQSPFDADVLYYGSGEARGSTAGIPGSGVFKSTDHGWTWEQLAATANDAEFDAVSKVEHSQSDAQTLYAGTNAGCFRSTDAGLTWEEVDASGPTTDIVCFPDGNVLIAVKYEGMRWSATGAPNSFSLVTDPNLSTSMRRIGIANCPDQPDVVYATFENAAGDSIDNFYSSADGGIIWTPMTVPLTGSTQKSYQMVVGVHATDPDVLVVGAKEPVFSFDGGNTWFDLKNSHSDYHSFSMHPTNNDSFLLGNDGGVYAYRWAAGKLPTRDLNNGFAVTQFYGGGYGISGSVVIGGTQDNGTWKVNGVNEYKCGNNDGGFAYAHQQNPALAYRSWQGSPSEDGPIHLVTDFNTVAPDKGDRINNNVTMNAEGYNFINYYTMNNFDSDQLYVRTDMGVWRTVDQGTNWDRLNSHSITKINAIGCSNESDPVIYFNGTFLVKGFFRIDSAATAAQGEQVNMTSSMPAEALAGRVSSITVHPNERSTIFVSMGNYGDDPKVWKVTSALTTPFWQDISGDPLGTGLPEGLPVNYIEVHPLVPETVMFAATDFGLYYTVDAGTTWCKQSSIPNVPIEEIHLRASTKSLFVFTHGRGAWKMALEGCDPIYAAPSYHSSFENPQDEGWTNAVNDDFDWTKQSGATPTANTGPSAAFDGTFYIYAEASAPNNPEQEAIFKSPCFDLSGFAIPKVSYNVHSWGGDLGTLVLDVSTDGGMTWEDESFHSIDWGNAWIPSVFNMFDYVGETNVRFRFRVTTGTGELGDFAIDNFWLTEMFPKMAEGSNSESLAEDLKNNRAIAYPNPFGNRLNLYLPESIEGELDLVLFDLHGKELMRERHKITGESLTVDTTQLPAGAYALRLSAKGFMQTIKLHRQSPEN